MQDHSEILTFQITGDYIELCNVLKVMGWVESGGRAKHLISEGAVVVNGATELRKRYKTRVGDVVQFDGNTVRIEAPSAELTKDVVLTSE